MEKEELIKFLNEKINNLKDENRNFSEFIKQADINSIDKSNYERSINLIKYIKIMTIIQTLNLIDCIRKGNSFTTLFSCLVLAYILIELVRLELSADIIESAMIMEKFIPENNASIDKMQNAVNFLQSLTKEEEKKYLKLKI